LSAGKVPGRPEHPEGRCPARYIPAQALDDLVWQDLCEVLTHPDSLAHALERAQAGAWLPRELQARRAQLEQGRRHLQRQLERLGDAYQVGAMPLREYQQRRQTLESQLAALERRQQHLEARVDQGQAIAQVMTSMEGFCARVGQGLGLATFAQRRQLVELLIDRIIVTDGEVEIHYVIPTTPASEHVRFSHLRTNYLLLLSPVAQRRDLGGDPHGAARTGAPSSGAGAHPERGHPGESVGQDQSKGGPHGADGGKPVNGRKRHLLVDTLGLVLKVVVSAANVSDAAGGRLVGQAVHRFGPPLPRLEKIWADSAYEGTLEGWLREQLGWALEIVRRPPKPPGFQVQPHRWIVERTFAWWQGFRRWAKDVEYQLESSEAVIYAAMCHLLVRRLARCGRPASSPSG
jgi:transposase